MLTSRPSSRSRRQRRQPLPGLPGHDKSVDYVVDAAPGRRATTRSSSRSTTSRSWSSVHRSLQQTAPGMVTYVEGVDFGVIDQSDPGDVTAAVTAVDLQLGLGNTSTSGCEAADFAGFPAGNIALLQRGTCTFELKAENAAAAGAVGHRDLQPGQHHCSRPPGHPRGHAHGQQHQRHPGARHHLCAGRDAGGYARSADAGLRQHRARDQDHRPTCSPRRPGQATDNVVMVGAPPRLRRRRARHQRQRLRLGRDPRDRRADGRR